jgi:hypothetical protein
MDKFEFASPAWLAMMLELLAVYAKRAGAGFELSICEIYTGVPKHLDKHGRGQLAWHCIIKDGVLDFAETAIPEADVRTQSDYAFIVPIARKLYTPEGMPDALADLDAGTREGRYLSTSLNQAKVPSYFIDLHNDIAVRTL